jgi:hypothetical protein
MKKTKDGFMRDMNNPGAVINTDNNALQAYKLKKQKDKEIDNLKNEVKDIKRLLEILIDKIG